MSETYTKKAEAQSELEQAVRDYIKAAEADGDSIETISDQIADSVFNGSDDRINMTA